MPRRGNALRGSRQRPPARLHSVEADAVFLQQHPADHVLRRAVSGLGSPPIKIVGTRLILLDALAFEIERRQVSLTHGVATLCSQRQPAKRQRVIALDPQSLGKAGADIVLRPRDACVRKRSPHGERRRIVAALRRFVGLIHSRGDVRAGGRVGGRSPIVKNRHARLRYQAGQDSG
jgi:hypothetical protein